MVSRRHLLKLSALGTASFAAPLAYSASNITMTHNTGNPIGSTSPKDLSDNTRNLDYLCLGPNHSYLDRKGVPRKSWKGMEGEHSADQIRREEEFERTLAEKNSQFRAFMLSSGYQYIGDYDADGPLRVSELNQVLKKDGELWRARADLKLPHLTVDNWAQDSLNFIPVGDAALRQELSSPRGASMVFGERLPLAQAINSGIQMYLSAGARSIWELSHLVTSRPELDDPNTWDWFPALQAAIDSGGSWYLPDDYGNLAIYMISKNLQLRKNASLSIFGPLGDRPRAQIRTTKTFIDRSMLRQWDESWYSSSETSKDDRPSSLEAHTALIDRYINIRHVSFYVDSDSGGEVSCLDFVAMQETSRLEGLIFSGRQGIAKGWPIRIRAGGGTEVSMNGCSIRGVVVYRDGWRGELKCAGSGSDLDVDGWITANTVHTESPFQFATIDVTLRNVHSEAFSVGNPTFKSTSTAGFSVSNCFVVIKDLQGDVFDSDGPPSLGLNTIYPVGGLSSNVTNRDSINLVVDRSGGSSSSTIRKVKLVPKNMGMISRIGSYQRNNFVCQDASGNALSVSPSSTNFILSGGSNNAVTPIQIPYRLGGLTDPNHYVDVVLFGRRASSGNPALLKVRLMQNNNFSGFAPRNAKIVENDNWPGVVTLSLSGEYYSVVTNDPDGVLNITATASGSVYFNSVNC